MKRQPVPPLLADVVPATYVVDASAWFDIAELQEPDEAWSIIEGVLQQDRIAAPVELLDELRPDDNVWPRLRPFEARIRTGGDETYLLLAGAIAAQFPGIARIRSKRTRADPFVIALAERYNYTVVTDETNARKPNRKIPAACKKRGVKCITLGEMLEIERDVQKGFVEVTG